MWNTIHNSKSYYFYQDWIFGKLACVGRYTEGMDLWNKVVLEMEKVILIKLIFYME